ncbi:hypothetical protein J6590_081192 [Homalodisca vitripennis]|nr:hypothetical protein J6590_081192 [Homalodisca vitripennis]
MPNKHHLVIRLRNPIIFSALWLDNLLDLEKIAKYTIWSSPSPESPIQARQFSMTRSNSHYASSNVAYIFLIGSARQHQL